MVLGLVALVALIAVRGLLYRGDVAPGVEVAGVAIGGLSPDAAKERLRAELGPRLGQTVNVAVDRQKAQMVPADLDARIDYTRTVDEAMQTGRLRSILLPFAYSASVDPTIAI
ncbi:MAG: hypothetical protein ACKO7Q_01935, partial [Actinomycetota bacterium]